MKLKFIAAFLFVAVISSCSKVPLTGRSQLSLVDEGQMMTMAASSYSEYLKENPVVPTTNKDAQRVKRVGGQLIDAVTRFMNQNGYANQIANYKWEVNLIQNKELNAWCMPGGKMAVFTGILPVCKDDAGLATVMGHEIAHAIARHGSERMSQQLAAEAGAVAGGMVTANSHEATSIFNQLYGTGAPLLLLKYSRKQESEADHLGLIFMAMAGYNPNTAVDFWQRMSASATGQKPPEILSTHPSDQTRIDDIKRLIPEAMKYYNNPQQK
ncbi:M48 family metallopeptidase [Solitalea koreensis]|uniref:Peptidase family M48 n=1 Tax=Solitalea koreensis TaxID=543615 RepID=A0A521DXA5_9SPHI|nr:M48 family metallopeptidase [Solitalea koreensis]SMO76359.1 Peptidase family M48 [Solitalea koreensis]